MAVYYDAKNDGETTLANTLALAETTSFLVNDGSQLPTGGAGTSGFIIKLEDTMGNREYIECSHRSGNTVYISNRGFEGTFARDWVAGSYLKNVFTKATKDEITDKILIATDTAVGTPPTSIEDVETDLNTHLAESVSEQIRVTRDLSIDGTQTITLTKNKIPKQIRINCCVNDSIKASIGTWSEGETTGSCIFTYGASHLWARNVGGIVRIAESTTTVRTNGTISNVRAGAFDIIWLKNSTGATGTADLFIDVSYHE